MKLISSIFATAILLASVTATAQDWTYLGALQPQQSQQKSFKLTDKQSTIEVFGGNYDSISCKFVDYDGRVTLEQNNVARCVGKTNPITVLPWKFSVIVTNNENKPITYKIWVHETK